MPRFALACLLAVGLLGLPSARATWSIVLVDRATGEVGIAGATCLESFDLLAALPVLRVGVGGACAQSSLDQGAVNRKKIWDLLQAGLEPAVILEEIRVGDLLKCSRQYGLAVLYDAEDPAAAFTGACAGAAKKDATGSLGTLSWAVQGNVLAGPVVVDAAVEALLAAPGRLSDKLMAGMQAALLWGGDGRCSCTPAAPTSCGAPPPEFSKSAHIGFLLTARIGDPDGVCNGALGCANGDYWLKRNVLGTAAHADPVLQLQAQYDAFLAELTGRPDGLLSTAVFDDAQVLGDGASTRELRVALVDVHGTPLAHSPGGVVHAVHAPGSAGLSAIESLTDHGDGAYTLHLRAGRGTGVDLFALTFDDGTTRATLYPYPALEHRLPLLAEGVLSGGTGGRVDFDLLAPDAFAGRLVLLDLSLAGPAGGQGPALLPDRLSLLVPRLASAGVIGGMPGLLDRGSRAAMTFAPPPGFLAPLVGLEIWAAFSTARPTDYWSNALALPVEP